MRVILAEKPSVARDIARVLGCERREEGFFSGANAIVTYAIGHLVNLPMPETLNPAWAGAWTAAKLPMIPAAWQYVANPKTAGQFAIVKRLLNARATTEVVNAADAGREGEAIFRRIYALAGCRKPVLRFWASSLTEEAIREALERLRPAADYDALADSAQTRAEVDWLWGMNYTRAYTIANGTLCTVGRVQTPTLALIVAREAQIDGFVKTFFYQLHAQPPGFVAKAINPDPEAKGSFNFEEKPPAEAIQRAIPPGAEALIESVAVKQQSQSPPQLYNLGALQKDANNRFRYTAARTLELAQSLYENHKVLTYPRTSSRHIGTDMVPALAGTLRAIHFHADPALVAAAITRAEDGPPLTKNYVDDTQLSDHHAIIPTRKSAARLSEDERNVYNLVATRFLAIFLPDKRIESTRAAIDIAGHKFAALGSRVLEPGWSALHGGRPGDTAKEDGEPIGVLPPLKRGERYPVESIELKTKERKPPSRYTDATLIAAMETAGKSIDDDELRAIMKGKGLGTEATRSAIILRLEQSEYITREGKFFVPTAKGTSLIAQVGEQISSPSLTAAMEEKLAGIEQGEYNSAELREEIEGYLRENIPEVLAQPRAARAEPKPRDPNAPAFAIPEGAILCPKCRNGEVRKAPGQNFYGCSAFRQGCDLRLWEEIAQKTITPAQIKALCSKKARTPLIKGFISKAGKKFDACLVLDASFKTTFEFER
jgi:DNA topoisomerase-3